MAVKRFQLMVRVSDALVTALDRHVHRNGVPSRQALVISILENWLENERASRQLGLFSVPTGRESKQADQK